MSKRTSPLDNVSIAAPCSVGWDSMVGDERVRFCGQCSLNVYNLSAMTKMDAERLVSQAEGRLCIRYYRRADGTILTSNCPVGLRALKRRMSRIASASAAAVISFLGGILAVTGLRERPLIPIGTQGVLIRVNEKLPDSNPVMGTYAAKPVYIKGQMARDDFASVAGRMEVLGRKR
jgi:hypothetical protein